MVDGINSHLARLDNGGFEVVIAGPVNKMSQSDVRLGDTYVDRVDKNKTKKFSVQDVVAQTFAFQEAVFKLPAPSKHEVNLRILFMKETRPYTLQGTAEEMCICDQHPVFNFGCVAIFAIRHLDQWTFHTSIFAHEIGHTLGAEEHDDEHYQNNADERLLMWSKVLLYDILSIFFGLSHNALMYIYIQISGAPQVGRNATIWSPEARTAIASSNHSCLNSPGILELYST